MDASRFGTIISVFVPQCLTFVRQILGSSVIVSLTSSSMTTSIGSIFAHVCASPSIFGLFTCNVVCFLSFGGSFGGSLNFKPFSNANPNAKGINFPEFLFFFHQLGR